MHTRIKMTAATLLLFFLLPLQACSKPKGNATVQNAVVAGGFYPADPAVLKKMVEGFIAQAQKKSFDGTIMGVIAPHAGYEYSGPVAAAAFKQLEGLKFKRVVVLGLSHRVFLDGAAISTRDVYRTPLGDIPIDTEAVRDLIGRNAGIADDQRPFEVEHSLEVELPFIQTVLHGFKLVPIIVGAQDPRKLTAIAEALARTFPDKDTLFVASTDLSHYMPYDAANETDRKTIALVTNDDPIAYFVAARKSEAELCGESPVFVFKRIARMRGAKIELVLHENSGDTAGDRSRVVGYGAFVAVEPPSIGAAQKEELLKLARATVVAHVTGKKLPQLPNDPALKKDGAAFVTLNEKGQLRGCIGHIIAQGPLDKCVQEMAVAAASQDPRFPPVRPEELGDISIEISVLTPPEPLSDPLAVRVGTDGLIIKKGFNQGVLLPQVPTAQGWSKEQFLEGICQKAGLPQGSWKDAELMRFQAIVFHEGEK